MELGIIKIEKSESEMKIAGLQEEDLQSSFEVQERESDEDDSGA